MALRRQGATILLVEGDVHTALSVARRGYVPEAGLIQPEGVAKELREVYLGGG